MKGIGKIGKAYYIALFAFISLAIYLFYLGADIWVVMLLGALFVRYPTAMYYLVKKSRQDRQKRIVKYDEKGKVDEWYEQHAWFRVIVWVLGIPFLVISYFLNYAWIILPILLILVVLFMGVFRWFTENPLYIIGAVAVVVLARVFLWRRKKLKERKKAVVWESEDQLKGLQEKLDKGIITQEEYEQEKGKLLEESE